MIDLPIYDGKWNIETFLDWIKNIENFFNYIGIAEHKKVHLVALKLKGGASACWDQITVKKDKNRGGSKFDHGKNDEEINETKVLTF